MSTDLEQWRPIPGCEGLYEASTLGRIRSLDRFVERPVHPPFAMLAPKRSHVGRILTPTLERGKRLKVSLSINGRHRYCCVARLVGETWLGTPPAGHCIAHVSDDQTDNRVENLTLVRTRVVRARAGAKNRGRLREKCRRGHRLTGSNIQHNPCGSRQCRECVLMTRRARSRRAREAA